VLGIDACVLNRHIEPCKRNHFSTQLYVHIS